MDEQFVPAADRVSVNCFIVPSTAGSQTCCNCLNIRDCYEGRTVRSALIPPFEIEPMPTSALHRSTTRLARLRKLHPRTPHHGGALAVVFLVLAGIFLIVAIAGFFFFRSGLETVTTKGEKLAADLKATGGVAIVSPGESTITFDSSSMLVIGALSSDELDGVQYAYPPVGGATVVVKDEAGTELRLQPIQMQPMQLQNGSQHLHAIGFTEVKTPGTYTIAASGGTTVVRALAVSQSEFEALVKGGLGVAGGVAGIGCGGIGFLLFGVIGGVLVLFGKKKPQLT